MIPTSMQYFVVSYIIIRIYMLDNSVINHAPTLYNYKNIISNLPPHIHTTYT